MDDMERLQAVLLEFIERELKKEEPEPEIISSVPAMVEMLIRTWGY